MAILEQNLEIFLIFANLVPVQCDHIFPILATFGTFSFYKARFKMNLSILT